MKMHEHDQEIIMALAEGTLDDAATAAAESAISACPECTADLDLQRFALAALDEVPAAYLTATESARLHKALKTELVGATTPPVRAKTSFAWGRWLPVAGVAAVFLAAIVSLPSLFGGSSDDADSTVAAPALESAETRAATETTAAAAQDMSDGAEMMAGDADDAMALEAPTATTESMAEATTTTAAMSDTTTSADRHYSEDLEFLGNVEDLERDALLEIVISERDALDEESRAAKDLDAVFAACVLTNTSPDFAPALGIPIDSEALLLGLVATSIDEELVLVAYVPEDVDETVFVLQQAYFCEVVEVLP